MWKTLSNFAAIHTLVSRVQGRHKRREHPQAAAGSSAPQASPSVGEGEESRAKVKAPLEDKALLEDEVAEIKVEVGAGVGRVGLNKRDS